jgi:hypothetical protein
VNNLQLYLSCQPRLAASSRYPRSIDLSPPGFTDVTVTTVLSLAPPWSLKTCHLTARQRDST